MLCVCVVVVGELCVLNGVSDRIMSYPCVHCCVKGV